MCKEIIYPEYHHAPRVTFLEIIESQHRTYQDCHALNVLDFVECFVHETAEQS